MSGSMAALPPLVFIALLWGGAWWIKKRIFDATNQRDSKGRSIPLTGFAKTHTMNLPIDLSLAARIGNRKAPTFSDGAITIRPTTGLRVLSGLLALVCGVAVVSDPNHFDVPPIGLYAGGALLTYMVLVTNFAYARYDADGVTAPGYAFQPKQALWKDIATLKDDGHYLYILRTKDGRRIEIQKFLTGVEDFLAYAMDQISYHNGQNAPP